MADRYWVGGSANWDGTAGTKWATTSGGTGGASVPTSADDVFFDAGSGAATVTISSGNTGAKSINYTGFIGTLGGNASITIAGSITLVAGMTYNYNGQITITGTGTITSAAKSFNGPVIINGVGITVTLGDAWILAGGGGTLTLTNGTLTTNNYNLTTLGFISDNTNNRTLNLGSSTVTLTFNGWSTTTNTNFTLNAGTSTVIISNTGGGDLSAGPTNNSAAAGLTFYNVSFVNMSFNGTRTISGINTFNNLTLAGPIFQGVVTYSITARQTINGTLATTSVAGNRRVFCRTNSFGIAQTLTINSSPSLTDIDFRDIYVVGTAAPISGTRIGDLRGCSGITFSAPKTVYWNLAGAQNWSANGWAATSTGTPSTDNFPLAQDTATFTNAGSVTGTITMDTAVFYTGTIDMSGRTSAMTLNFGTSYIIHGDWKNGSGTTLTGAGPIHTFAGRNTQTITSAGKSFPVTLIVQSFGGTVELADALTVAGSFRVFDGTFDTKNFNLSCVAFQTGTTNTQKAIKLGSSTLTLSGNSVLVFSGSPNLTFDAGTSTINLTGATFTFDGGGYTFYNVATTEVSSASEFTFLGTNTFNNLTINPLSSAGIVRAVFSANQTINGTLTVAGASPVRRIFVSSNTLGTTRTLTVNTLSATDCDFRDITIAGSAAGSSPTRAGDCGGNSGITFPAPKTVYWNLAGAQNWTATAWASSSGGTPDINNFPLAQDTAVFDNTGSVTGTITISTGANIGTFNASARTSAMTLANGDINIYGNWTSGTGVTYFSSNVIFNFTGRGTQTITSNGVSFANVRINPTSVGGKVVLADALVSLGQMQHNNGEFDAVTYNVTVNGYESTSTTNNRRLRMGSGTWTIAGGSGTTVWAISVGSTFTLYKGTANILLSNNGTGGRTFVGGGLSYNKLTIGGATGTSTLTITGNNQFTELASTKTVAHTIDFGATTQTFGAWTVTGTAGNVVTLTGTGTSHILAGACTSGIDYLAMGSIGFAATSPGEFYAGANSTGTAGAPVYRTAKPADSTRYWVGGTGNWSDTARWSTGSGGSGGASVPRSHDDVVFDSASNATAYTATVNAVTGGIRMKSLTIAGPASGNLTLAGSTAIDGIHGNVTLPSTGLTRTYTGSITLSGSSTGLTFTTNGVSIGGLLTINGVGCEWTLGSALNAGSNTITVSNGAFKLSTYNLTSGPIATNATVSGLANSITIDLGSSTFTSASTAVRFGTTETYRAVLTFNAGTSQINCPLLSLSLPFDGNNQTFYNVAFTGNSSGTTIINGANTFNNLTFTGSITAGLREIRLSGNQTVNGTLTFSAGTNATMRQFVRSDVLGTTRTITAAAFSGTDVDFRDITIAGAAAPISGTRFGDCKGNSGITFTAPKTVYWNLATGGNWSATGWATTGGGTPAANNFPLAQDTAVFQSTGLNSGATITVDAAYNIGTVDMSARTTNTMTLASGSITPTIYGNWINGAGTTISGTTTLIFAGRGSQTITSAGKTFTQGIAVNTPGGSVTLQDAFTTTTAGFLTLTSGTFNTGGFNVTMNSGGFSSTGGITRTLNLGASTFVVGISGTAWDTTTSTNLTVTGTGTISLTSASAKTFAGGGTAYTDITLNQGGAGTLTITGNNTFKDITNTYKATGATNITFGTTTQRVSQFTAAGEAGRVLTLQGTSASSPSTIILTGATDPNVDYVTITGIRAYALTDTWYAGANSTNNGSLGWIFSAATPPVVLSTGNFFFLLGL